MLTWDDCSIVERIPGKVSGAWVIKDTRLPLWAIFENLQSAGPDEVAEIFGGVTGDQIKKVLHHFSEMLRDDLIVRVPAVPGTPETKSMGELEAEYPRKHFAIFNGELIGVCDTWEKPGNWPVTRACGNSSWHLASSLTMKTMEWHFLPSRTVDKCSDSSHRIFTTIPGP